MVAAILIGAAILAIVFGYILYEVGQSPELPPDDENF